MMKTIGCTEEWQNPSPSLSLELVGMIREPLSGYHQGQRSSRAALKGRTHDRTKLDHIVRPFFLASHGPSTHDGFQGRDELERRG